VRAVPVRPPVAAPTRTVPVLRSLLGWLTAPRFLHRNPCVAAARARAHGRHDRECGRRARRGIHLMLTLLFDGIAYGMLLFILAVGLAVTLGLMNFINLAHGAFAMAGGYVTVLLMNRADVPFVACLVIAFFVTALVGAVLERTLYRPMYARPHLDQVLFSIGLVFIAVTAVDYFVGSMQQNIRLPEWLQGRLPIEAVGIGKYRLFIVVVCALLTVLLQWVLSRTRFGSRLRAAVDDPRTAAGLGLDVDRIFLATFAVGSGLAGLGGALGAEVLGLDPTFPLKFMIYFLIVVSVGGTTTITGPLLAALLLGIADVAGKYYIPKLGAFIVYTLMIAILLWRPQGLFARTATR
jgi:branched-chain amino acid transport system permease protein